jgi:hypothetical protein
MKDMNEDEYEPVVMSAEDAALLAACPELAAIMCDGDHRPVEVPRRGRPAYTLGGPPTAGMIRNDGQLIVWQDGEPVVLARFARPGEEEQFDLWMDGPRLARWTAHGILLQYEFPGAEGYQFDLLREDGTTTMLGEGFDLATEVIEGGRCLVATASDSDHLADRQALHLIDLVDGTRRAVPWSPGGSRPAIIGAFDDWLYVNTRTRVSRTTWQWRPGTEPKPLPEYLTEIDSLSGAALTGYRQVIRPDGTRHDIAQTCDVQLTPGGAALYSIEDGPPKITLFDLAIPGRPQRSYELPADAAMSEMIWEDLDHVLIPAESTMCYEEHPVRAYRLNVATGHLDLVPNCGTGPLRPTFVRPLHISCAGH